MLVCPFHVDHWFLDYQNGFFAHKLPGRYILIIKIDQPWNKTGWCLTLTLLLICSSFSRENGYPLLICSSLSTAQKTITNPKMDTDSLPTMTRWTQKTPRMAVWLRPSHFLFLKNQFSFRVEFLEFFGHDDWETKRRQRTVHSKIVKLVQEG